MNKNQLLISKKFPWYTVPAFQIMFARNITTLVLLAIHNYTCSLWHFLQNPSSHPFSTPARSRINYSPFPIALRQSHFKTLQNPTSNPNSFKSPTKGNHTIKTPPHKTTYQNNPKNKIK